MSKIARQRKHSEKMARKRAIKAAKRAKYSALAGTSKKRKRQGTTNRSPYKHVHVMSDCGNAGCKRCHPRIPTVTS